MSLLAPAGSPNLRHFPEYGNVNTYQDSETYSYNAELREKSEIEAATKPPLLYSARASYGEVKADAALTKLRKLQSHAAPGVRFEQAYLENSCYGGTCSAQSLRFAQEVATSSISPLHKRVIKVASKSEVADIDHRTSQAALNAITMDRNRSVDDFSRAKVESIVALRDFEVVSASRPLDEIISNKLIEMTDDREVNLYRAFKKEVLQLSDGIYFTRLLSTADNHKKESFGHSIIFIKSQEGNFLWDPADGLYEIPAKELTSKLFKIYKDVTERWWLTPPRFYKIVQKDAFIDRVRNFFPRITG